MLMTIVDEGVTSRSLLIFCEHIDLSHNGTDYQHIVVLNFMTSLQECSDIMKTWPRYSELDQLQQSFKTAYGRGYNPSTKVMKPVEFMLQWESMSPLGDKSSKLIVII